MVEASDDYCRFVGLVYGFVMGLFNRIFFGHLLDDWAQDNTLIAARILNKAAADIIVAVEVEIQQVGWIESVSGQAQFVSREVAPLVRSIAEPLAEDIIANANSSLNEIVDINAVWIGSPEHIEQQGSAFEGGSTIAAAAGPFAVGVAAAALVPGAAITTTTAFFGLVATTAISWPVVIGGSAIAGVGLATGIVNTAKIKQRMQEQLRQRCRQFVLSSLMKGTEQNPSILEQLSSEFSSVAKKAKSL